MREGGLEQAVRQAYKVYKSIYIMKKKAEPGQQSNKLSRIISKLSILFLAIIVAEVSRILDKVSIAIELFRYSTGYLMIHSYICCVQSKR